MIKKTSDSRQDSKQQEESFHCWWKAPMVLLGHCKGEKTGEIFALNETWVRMV